MLYTFTTRFPSDDPIILCTFEKYGLPLPMAIDTCAYETALPLSWKDMLGHSKHTYGGVELHGVGSSRKPGVVDRLMQREPKPRPNAFTHFERGMASEPDDNGNEWRCDAKFKVLLAQGLDDFEHGIIGRCFIDKFWDEFSMKRAGRTWTVSFKAKDAAVIPQGRHPPKTGTQKLKRVIQPSGGN